MRVLVSHNRYRFSGGEDSVVRNEVAMLRSAGHEVEMLEADNRTIEGPLEKLAAARSVFHSARSQRRTESLLREFRPDIVHLHNWFPLLSPVVATTAARCGIPVVQTLHNFRMVCATANLFRDGKICCDCVGKAVPVAPMLHGCYAGSRTGSAAVAAGFAWHRMAHTWDNVSTFIALTEFQRELLVRGGLDPARIVVKPNFVRVDEAGRGRGGYALFVGRLVPEKGVRTVLRAWEQDAGLPPLKIMGDGPLANEVRAHARQLLHVEYLGQQPRSAVAEAMCDARLLVFASESYETFALTLLESLASGTPSVAADLPSIAGLVRDGETGLLFAPGDGAGLAAKVRQLDASPAYHQMRRSCRAVYEERYTEAINYELLMAIYRRACARRHEQLMLAPESHMGERPSAMTSEPQAIERVNVLGIGVHAVDMDKAVAVMRAVVEERRKGYICLAGAHGIMEARRRPALRAAFDGAQLVAPDGMPTVWMGRLQGLSQMRRVFGPDLMLEIIGRRELSNWRHFLCGGTPGTARQLREALSARFPWASIVGTYTPPFRAMTAEEEEEFADRVRLAQPHVVWIGISTPKQELFMARMLPRLETRLMVGVGAAFLYHTGAIRDSPSWVKAAGLQWVHRLLQEPSRLWRRYLLTVPSFLFHAAMQAVGLPGYAMTVPREDVPQLASGHRLPNRERFSSAQKGAIQ